MRMKSNEDMSRSHRYNSPRRQSRSVRSTSAPSQKCLPPCGPRGPPPWSHWQRSAPRRPPPARQIEQVGRGNGVRSSGRVVRASLLRNTSSSLLRTARVAPFHNVHSTQRNLNNSKFSFSFTTHNAAAGIN